MLAATGHSGRAFSRRDVCLFSATDRHGLDIANGANCRFDLRGSSAGVELERKPSIEVVRFERRRRRLDAMHTAELLRFADDQHRPTTL